MNHGEDESIRRFMQDASSADKVQRRWLQGPQITAEDLRHGTGSIERVTSAQWFKLGQDNAGGRAGSPDTHRAGQSAGVSGGRGGSLMGFGKYAGRLMADVREDDPGYWAWCLREIAPFAARARKAGLLDDEEDAA